MPSTDRILIRPATQAGSSPLFTLARAFATSFTVEQEAFDRTFTDVLQTPAAFLAVAEEEGVVLGYVLCFEHLTFYANGRVAGWRRSRWPRRTGGEGSGGV